MTTAFYRRMRSALAPFVVALLSCTAGESRPREPAPTETMAKLRALGAIAKPLHAEALSVRIPELATAPLRIGEGDAWLEITPNDMREVRAAYVDGATVYASASADLDLVYVRESARVEELRLAKTRAAAANASWNLRKGPGISTLQIVDGSIEAVDHKAIVRLRSEPMFAIDSNGVRRAMSLELHGSTVAAHLDATDLATPIAIDPAWVAAAAPSGLARVITPMVTLSSGKVLLAGGQLLSTGTRLSTAEIYDPATNTWTATASMSAPRAEHTANAHAGDKKVVFAGGYGINDLSTVDVYDETTGTFAPIQNMPSGSVGPMTTAERRAHVGVTLNDGRILVVGGEGGGGYRQDMFFVDNGVVGPMSSTKLPEGLADMLAVVLTDGRVLIASGRSNDSSGSERYSSKAWLLTISGTTITIADAAEMPVARLQARGFVPPVGPNKDRAIFVGGAIQSTTSEKTLVTSQAGVIYDPVANKWLPLPATSKKRFIGFGALIPGGKYLFTGGSNDIVVTGTANQDAEVLDLNTMVWKPAGTMIEPRGGHWGAVLKDGSLFLNGGVRAIDDGFLILTTGSEKFTLQAMGASCAADGECSSGFCADGVCCDKACNGQCEACDVTKGTCKPVTGEPRGKREKCRIDVLADPGCNLACNGTDEKACQYPTTTATCSKDECVDGKERHASTCDGAGKCKDVVKECGDYACSGKLCNTTCTTKADCVHGNHFCEAGKCIPQQANGSTCTRDEACASGICVDGTCCETKCDGQCQACDVPGQAGKCVPIKGKPHGMRADCTKNATNACESKSCDGIDTTSCAGTVGPCANYACDDVNKTCKKSCIADVDCGSGFQCDTATASCVPRTSRCIGTAELQAADGSKTKCTAFICRDGACLDKCTSTNDCQGGYICGGDGACSPLAGQSAGDEGGCAMARSSEKLSAFAALLIAMGLVRRRR
jgi:hypothetical protein